MSERPARVDRLEVALLQRERFGAAAEAGASLRVNRRELLDLVRDAERPFAAAEGHPDLAGAYADLPAAVALPPSRHLLGEPSPLYEGRGGKVALLACECGEPGCWPLMARVIVRGSTATWQSFEQPHRRDAGPSGPWRYDGLGPFVFERTQYEAALEQAAQAQDHPRDPGTADHGA